MSVISSDYIQCETIQMKLNDEFETCLTPLESMPFLEAVLSTQKALGISQSTSDGNGKVKNVKVVYDQRLLESEVTAGSGARSCSSTAETFNNYANYTIDPTLWIKGEESFDVANLATVCTDDVQSMIAKKLNKIADAIERKIATQTANESIQWIGAWGTEPTSNYTITSDALVVPQYAVTATKQIDYTTLSTIDSALMMNGYCGQPIIVGGSKLWDYMKFANHGCCATSGVNVLDMANEYGKAVMWDKRVKNALGGDEYSLVFQAGSLALITYNEAAQVPNIGANYAKFRINAPRTGIPIDVVMKDDCGHISIIGYANTKLVGLPNDLFKVGDEYRGVTYVNKIKVVNPA